MKKYINRFKLKLNKNRVPKKIEEELTKKMPNLFFQFLANSIKYTFLNYGDKHQ
jgi:hypothetical protein